jgi:hypothetical protein
MADAETEAEWAKMRRVAKEKEKAAKALEKTKRDSVVLSYLDPKPAKTSGFSANRETVMRAVEKFANASIIFMIFGVTLSAIARAGGMVTSIGHLGVGGAIIAGIPQAISMICILIAIVSAITGIISSIYTKIKYKTKMNYTILVCIITLVIFGIFEFLKTKIW